MCELLLLPPVAAAINDEFSMQCNVPTDHILLYIFMYSKKKTEVQVLLYLLILRPSFDRIGMRPATVIHTVSY